jgi:Polyketide cyclase / dehydrase and lipid transport
MLARGHVKATTRERGGHVIVRSDVVLPTTLARAWDLLVDWERQADWMRDADRVDVLTAHREGLGVVVAVKTRVLNVPLFTEELKVVAWEPPRLLRIEHGSFVHGVGEWRLTPVARGGERGTRFIWEERLSLRVPLLGGAALRVYRPFMARLMRGSLANLGRLLGEERPR